MTQAATTDEMTVETTIPRRRLGGFDRPVSTIGLGTMTFGAETDEATSHAVLDAYLRADGNLIDLADVYADGETERIVGRRLASMTPAERSELVLVTKGRFPVTGQPGASLSADYLRRALQASLRRLGVDRIDVYLAHGPDAERGFEDFAAFAAEALSAGTVGAVGVSNLTGWQLIRADQAVREATGTSLVAVQPQYNLLVREPEWEVLPAAADVGAGVMAWGPMGAGWLTGKYRPGTPPPRGSRLGDDPGRGLEAWDRRGSDRTWSVVAEVSRVAAELGCTPGQLAVAWVIGRPGVSTAVVGARTVGHLTSALPAAGLTIPPEAVAALDAVSTPQTPDYPYRFVADISAPDSDGVGQD